MRYIIIKALEADTNLNDIVVIKNSTQRLFQNKTLILFIYKYQNVAPRTFKVE